MEVRCLIRRALVLWCLAVFSSCSAPRPSSGPEAAAAPSGPLARPARQISLVPSADAPRPRSRTEQIVEEVKAGRLVETNAESLIFSLPVAPPANPGGLFEDAVVLGRLRSQLKKVPGLPEAIVGSATVQGSKAYLRIGDALSETLAARAIDAALRTNGVSLVTVSTAPDVRL